MEDTNDEGTPLLKAKSEEEEGEDDIRTKGLSKRIPLILFCIFFYIGNIGSFTLFPQYLLYRFKQEANFTSLFGNETLDPCMINRSDPLYIEDQKIQQKSSKILAAAHIAGGIPSLISVVIYGALSDRIGRKNIIYISYIGLVITTVGLSFLVNFDWNPYIYAALSFINGCCGSHASMIAALFAYIADVTTKKQRALAIAIIEGSLGLALIITQIALGWAIKIFHFGIPIIFLTSISVISIFLLCCVEETVKPNSESSQNQSLCDRLKAPFGNMKRLLEFDKTRSVCLILLTLSFTLFMLIFTSMLGVSTLYLMDIPFCWNSVEYGMYGGIRFAIWMVCAFVLIAVFRKKKFSDYLILLGLISFIASCILSGMASSLEKPSCNIFMIIAAVAGFMTSVPPILMKAAASKLVSSEEQGATFGLISTGEAFSFSFGSTIATVIYGATLSFMKGFVFYFCAGVIILTFILMLAFLILSRPLMAFPRYPNQMNEINF